MGIEEYLDNVKGMIDDLKAMTADLGLANTGDEYKIISELFTYKFLNDKLVHEFENRQNKDESYQDFIKGEVRYASLAKLFPDKAEEAYKINEEDAKRRLDTYKRMAGKA